MIKDLLKNTIKRLMHESLSKCALSVEIIEYEWKIYPRKQDDLLYRLHPMTLGAGLQDKPKADVLLLL